MQHTVRFSEVDAAGIVFFSRVFEWCHHAFEDVLRARGLPITDVADRPWLMPLVHASADYRRPLRLGDAVDIAVQDPQLGEGSVTWSFEIRGADGVCATVRHVHACIDRETFRPIPVPDSVRRALEAG